MTESRAAGGPHPPGANRVLSRACFRTSLHWTLWLRGEWWEPCFHIRYQAGENLTSRFEDLQHQHD